MVWGGVPVVAGSLDWPSAKLVFDATICGAFHIWISPDEMPIAPNRAYLSAALLNAIGYREEVTGEPREVDLRRLSGSGSASTQQTEHGAVVVTRKKHCMDRRPLTVQACKDALIERALCILIRRIYRPVALQIQCASRNDVPRNLGRCGFIGGSGRPIVEGR